MLDEARLDSLDAQLEEFHTNNETYNANINSVNLQLDAFQRFTEDHHANQRNIVQSYAVLLKDYRQLLSDFEEERESREKWKRLYRAKASGSDKNPFILVLIDGNIVDGNGYIFNKSFVEWGKEGGADAAQQLDMAVKNQLSNAGVSVEGCEVVVRFYCNLKDLSRHFAVEGLVGHEARSLALFTTGFTCARGLFDVIDAGESEDGTIIKVKDCFNLFAESSQCRHIVFGGCHESEYLTLLEPYKGKSDRLTLLKAASYESDFDELNLPSVGVPAVFRSTAQQVERVSAVKSSVSRGPGTKIPLTKSKSEPPQPVKQGPARRGLCPDYPKGKCRLGSSCKLVHIETIEDRMTLGQLLGNRSESDHPEPETRPKPDVTDNVQRKPSHGKKKQMYTPAVPQRPVQAWDGKQEVEEPLPYKKVPPYRPRPLRNEKSGIDSDIADERMPSPSSNNKSASQATNDSAREARIAALLHQMDDADSRHETGSEDQDNSTSEDEKASVADTTEELISFSPKSTTVTPMVTKERVASPSSTTNGHDMEFASRHSGRSSVVTAKAASFTPSMAPFAPSARPFSPDAAALAHGSAVLSPSTASFVPAPAPTWGFTDGDQHEEEAFSTSIPQYVGDDTESQEASDEAYHERGRSSTIRTAADQDFMSITRIESWADEAEEEEERRRLSAAHIDEQKASATTTNRARKDSHEENRDPMPAPGESSSQAPLGAAGERRNIAVLQPLPTSAENWRVRKDNRTTSPGPTAISTRGRANSWARSGKRWSMDKHSEPQSTINEAREGEPETVLQYIISSLPKESDQPKGSTLIPVNQQGKRLDFFMDKPPEEFVDMLKEQQQIHGKLCNDHHLLNNCTTPKCSYKHGTLHPKAKYAFKYWVRQHPCSARGACRKARCLLGHVCQKSECEHGAGRCWFDHGIDLKLHSWVESDTKRERLSA